MLLKLIAFFNLIRWPNLLMLGFTQMMLNYFVIGHMFQLIHLDLPLNSFNFMLLVLSTLFMAVFGYIFNDIQDEDVDEINKAEKKIIGVQINRTTALISAWTFLAFSLGISIYLGIALQMVQLIFLHFLIGVGLWYYSTHLKKTVLIGNFIISLFTGFSVFIVWLYHLAALRIDPILMVDAQRISEFVTYTVVVYSVFAFLISMIREITKDIEDKEGDERTGMKTTIIKYGLSRTKIIIYFFITLMLFLLGIIIYITYSYNWLQLAIYLLVAVGIPSLYFIMNLRTANFKKDFKDLSLLAKIIMIAGILSMQLFYISYGS